MLGREHRCHPQTTDPHGPSAGADLGSVGLRTGVTALKVGLVGEEGRRGDCCLKENADELLSKPPVG